MGAFEVIVPCDGFVRLVVERGHGVVFGDVAHELLPDNGWEAPAGHTDPVDIGHRDLRFRVADPNGTGNLRCIATVPGVVKVFCRSGFAGGFAIEQLRVFPCSEAHILRQYLVDGVSYSGGDGLGFLYRACLPDDLTFGVHDPKDGSSRTMPAVVSQCCVCGGHFQRGDTVLKRSQDD